MVMLEGSWMIDLIKWKRNDNIWIKIDADVLKGYNETKKGNGNGTKDEPEGSIKN